MAFTELPGQQKVGAEELIFTRPHPPPYPHAQRKFMHSIELFLAACLSSTLCPALSDCLQIYSKRCRVYPPPPPLCITLEANSLSQWLQPSQDKSAANFTRTDMKRMCTVHAHGQEEHFPWRRAVYYYHKQFPCTLWIGHWPGTLAPLMNAAYRRTSAAVPILASALLWRGN